MQIAAYPELTPVYHRVFPSGFVSQRNGRKVTNQLVYAAPHYGSAGEHDRWQVREVALSDGVRADGLICDFSTLDEASAYVRWYVDFSTGSTTLSFRDWRVRPCL